LVWIGSALVYMAMLSIRVLSALASIVFFVGAGLSEFACSNAVQPNPNSGDAGVRDTGLVAKDTGSVPKPDAGGDYPPGPAVAWRSGSVTPVPTMSSLLALPGGGIGAPVVTSNNPEVFTGPGLLLDTSSAAEARGGRAYPLRGGFGVYLHHINQTGADAWVSLVVANRGTVASTVRVNGTAWTQTETGGLALGASPDFKVSDGWIRKQPNIDVAPFTLAPGAIRVVYQRVLGQNREIDGRFGVSASADVTIAVVASTESTLAASSSLLKTFAEGDIRVPGIPAPPFGREAGVYAFDTWASTINVNVPPAGAWLGYALNTAQGVTSSPDAQAFPALMRLGDSSPQAVGMYGNVYDITLKFAHDGKSTAVQRAHVYQASLGAGTPSRFWDGIGLLDGAPFTLRQTPADRTQLLFDVEVAPGATATRRFTAMVPGLASVPQALLFESY
jgi:Protein of unknown function (DUF3370)